MKMLFAAVRKSAFGTKRRFAAARMFGRFWGEADMPRSPLAYRPVESLTQSGHERVAFAATHTLTCYSL
ncbi:MAG: hypothetical protein JOZ26_01240 [Hyphomicrobiales bacterium]|nr:hypothetical protein [Hyphomicrobiales bacterium]